MKDKFADVRDDCLAVAQARVTEVWGPEWFDSRLLVEFQIARLLQVGYLIKMYSWKPGGCHMFEVILRP